MSLCLFCATTIAAPSSLIKRPYSAMNQLSVKNMNGLTKHLKQLDDRYGIVNLARVRNGKRALSDSDDSIDRFLDSFEKYWEDGYIE
jgi:hypothetical protein